MGAGHVPGAPRVCAGGVAAFFRVYEPLEALPDLPPACRARWRALAESNTPEDLVASSSAAMAAREHAAALRAATALPPRVVCDRDLDPEAAPGLLLRPPAADGVLRVCPMDLGWRALLALEDLRLSLQPAALYAFLPPAAVDDAARQLAASARRASRAPHVRSSAWHVPLAWFAAFRPEHRVVDEAPTSETSTPATASAQPALTDDDPTDAETDRVRPSLRSVVRTVRYLAPMADTRRCVARAIAATRRAPTNLISGADLEELGRWLEEFHARSVVELDYGGLVGLIPQADLAGDDSVAAVAAAVAELRAGSPSGAVAALTAVRDRWATVRALEHAS